MDKEYRVVWTKQADNNLYEITYYIREKLFAPAAALCLEKDYRSAAAKLSYAPHIWALVTKKRRYRRCIVRKNWLLFFVIDEKQNIVYVTHVTYGRRNWQLWMAR